MMRPYEIAMTYLNVPFKHRGRTRLGMDCIGLLVLIARAFGVTVYDQLVYGRDPTTLLREGLRTHCGPPVTRPLEINDILLMRLNPTDKEPSHVAIVAPHPYGLGMVHTYGEIGRVAYHRIDKHRRAQIVEVYAWPDPS